MVRKLNALSLLPLLWLSSPNLLPGQDQEPGCSITIAAPRPGQEVAAQLEATGTAKVPLGQHLWLFARRASYRSLELWWPQGEASLEAGHWEVLVSIGEARDIGEDFDVTAAVFAQEQHMKLREYFRNAVRNGYKPMEMPAASCVATMATVRKTSH